MVSQSFEWVFMVNLQSTLASGVVLHGQPFVLQQLGA